MKVTSKGQVTIPLEIRRRLGITVESEVDFKEDRGKIYIIAQKSARPRSRFGQYRGAATTRMSTEEILSLTRK
ncbi:MAG: AbrB/MazE/SpoVT family DNA-binding domain-containing protein [Spirochaetes bacterium]|nr:MAG: AbrB/MazE/SpoVT family DNA-binding domain-containing protein [Spirochaetota bacterium]